MQVLIDLVGPSPVPEYDLVNGRSVLMQVPQYDLVSPVLIQVHQYDLANDRSVLIQVYQYDLVNPDAVPPVLGQS